MFVCLFVCLFDCLIVWFVCLFVCLFDCLIVCLFDCLIVWFVWFVWFVCLSVCLFVFFFIIIFFFKVVECLEDVSAARAEAGLGVGGLQAMIGALKVMFATPGQLGETAMSVARFYRTHVSPLDRDKSRTFSYWCFHPGLALRVLRAQHGVRCVILASGTLSPMDALASELGSPFPVRLENPHVIHSSQVWAGVVSYGPAAIKMENTYNNRTNRDHLRDLGMAIVNFCRIVPDGLLVFFPSYAHLDLCVSSWQEAGESVWSGILKHKRVVQEPRLASQSAAAIAEFQAMINDGSSRGVVFLAVFRGKVAEGLDFSDRNGRAVVIVGVPFPSTMDARIVAKKKFLDTEKRSNPLMLSGEEWYLQQAACAVNQAIGRVIRHRFDYGAMIFLDARFETLVTEAAKPFVSTWIRPFVKVGFLFGCLVVWLVCSVLICFICLFVFVISGSKKKKKNRCSMSLEKRQFR